MKDASEGEQEDDFISQPTKTSDPKKSKAERAEQLRKMMEDDGNPPFPHPLPQRPDKAESHL